MSEVTYPIFSKEQSYPDMDYSDSGYRLLGLFRMWNALEYYFPYHDLLPGPRPDPPPDRPRHGSRRCP